MVNTIERMARERFWKLDLRQQPCPPVVEAAIDCRDWTLRFKLDPNAEENLTSIEIPVEEQRLLAEALVRHEMGHWEICPFDADGQFLLMEPISRVARERFIAYNYYTLNNSIHELANIVADIIVDTVGSWEDKSSRYADGNALFFLKELFRGPSLSPLYDVFLRLNLLLWGQRTSITKRIREYLSEDAHAELLQNLAALFDYRDEPDRLVSWLRERANWPALAEGIARLLIDLVAGQTSGGAGSSATGRPGDGTTDAVEQGTGALDRPSVSPSLGIGGLGRPSPFSRVLTVLYEGRAKAIKLAMEGEEGQPVNIPVTPLFCRPVDPYKLPPLERLVWWQTRCHPSRTGRARLELHQAEVNVEVPFSAIPGKGFLPDLAFVVDNSGSMGFDPHAGHGEYDLVLRTIFGVFQWLKDQQMAAYLRYAVLNFSSSTIYSGWQGWQNKGLLYSTLFDYQGGGTRLNIQKAEQLVRESRSSFVAIMVTDGELENDVEVAQYVASHFTPPGGFVLVQVGRVSRLATKLSSRGFRVHAVSSHTELKDLILGEVRGRYGV